MLKRTGRKIIPNRSNKNVYKLIIALALVLGIKPKQLVKNLKSRKIKSFVRELTDGLAKDRKSNLTKALKKIGVKVK